MTRLLKKGGPREGASCGGSVGSPSHFKYRSMPALVMTRARSFIRAPQRSQRSTSILNVRRDEAHAMGDTRERCVGGLYFFAVHVAQSASCASSSSGGGGGAMRALHLLFAASTPA